VALGWERSVNSAAANRVQNRIKSGAWRYGSVTMERCEVLKPTRGMDGSQARSHTVTQSCSILEG
jgi:hypothetical protein